MLNDEKQYHIQLKKGDVGKYVLLPGDPGRCEPIAALFDNPVHVASNREYNTYTGYLDGVKVSVTSTGIGCPSAAIALEELVRVGADTFIRVGTSGHIQPDSVSGELAIISAAIRDEGTSKHYMPIEFPAVADNAVITRLVNRANNLIETGGGTYKELRTLQKSVGSELNRVQKAPATYGEEQIKAIGTFYGGLANDVDAWAAPRTLNNKPVYTPAGAEHARAMEQFRNTVVPFRQDPDIYKIVSSKTPANDIDKIAQSFSLTGNPKTAELAVNLMSDNGRQAAQYSILNQARSAAINEDAAAMLSSPAFTRTLNLGRSELPSAQRMVMGQTPEVMDEVGLLRSIVDATRGAVTPKVSPATGQQLLPFVTAGVGVGAGREIANQFGIDPFIGGLAGGAVTPGLANVLGGAMSSRAGTRYLLGEQLQGAGGMGTAMGQAMNQAVTNPDEFIPQKPIRGLMDFFRN
jgi:uridine phosphorylase